MNNIPEYLNIEEEEEFSRWKRFAEFVRAHSSKYLTNRDRERMYIDLYQIERGYQADAEELKNAEATYAPFLKKVKNSLSHLVLIKDREYDWAGHLKNFGNRGSEIEFADQVARDVLLIEQINKFYESIKSGEYKPNQKFNIDFEIESFKMARYFDDLDHQNYKV